MSEVYIGEIRQFPYQRIPNGWLACAGQLLEISKYTGLYSLLSTQFGGDGRVNFALPDLRGRAILGAWSTTQNIPPQVGGKGGLEVVQLTIPQMPPHNHTLKGSSSNGTTPNPTNGYFAVPVPPASLTNPPANPTMYGQVQAPIVALNADAITPTGGTQPHENRQPFLAMTYCIATLGYYPPRD